MHSYCTTLNKFMRSYCATLNKFMHSYCATLNKFMHSYCATLNKFMHSYCATLNKFMHSYCTHIKKIYGLILRHIKQKDKQNTFETGSRVLVKTLQLFAKPNSIASLTNDWLLDKNLPVEKRKIWWFEICVVVWYVNLKKGSA